MSDIRDYITKATGRDGGIHLDLLHDFELSEIVSNPIADASLRETAKDILTSRKEFKAEFQKKSLIEDTFKRLDRALDLLEKISKRPLKAAILTALFAILVTVSINVLTQLTLKLINLR